MKHLYLLRHAKSASEAMTEDYDVPLSALGRRQAEAMAAYMARASIRPDLVLCSGAARARETCDILSAAGRRAIETVYEPRLYLASADRLLRRVREVASAIEAVLVVAHNPGLQHLATLLTADISARQGQQPGIALAPCTLAALRVPTADWPGIGPGDARLDALVSARELGA